MSLIGIVASSAAMAVGGALSARWNWWRPHTKGIPILMYHKIGDPPEGSKLEKLWVSTDLFRKQLTYLKKEGYSPITFKDLYDYWDGKVERLPEKPVILTFDDGYANNFTDGYPILKEFGFRAVLYVVVQTVGWNNHWHDPKSETRIPMISWAQLKELQKDGWEIGSHTMNHPNLTTLSVDKIKVEVEQSRKIITEFLDEAPDSFAYPYGKGEDVPEIREATKVAGYRTSVGIHAGKWTNEKIKSDPFHLPRVFVRGDENMFDFHLQITRGKSRL